MKFVAKKLANVIPAYANFEPLCDGKKVHEDVIRNGFGLDVFLESALVVMHSKC